MEFLSEKIGETRERTDQGYLVLRNVPIARTGEMLYGPGEIPVEPGKDGIIRITRSPDVVFHPDTIRSFQGAPVVIEHPEEDVDPSNWKKLTVGVLLDVRQGTGLQDNLLVADLLITDADAIKAIEDGDLHELSAGYDAGYVDDGDGRGRQVSIKGNHLALLSGAGRCGPVCSIGDSASQNVLSVDARNSDGAPVKKNKFFDAVRKAFTRSLDEAEKELEKEKDEETDPKPEGEPKPETKDEEEPTLADVLKRLDALEAAIKDLSDDDEEETPESAPEDTDDDEEDDEDEDDDEPTEDKKGKSKDAATLQLEISGVFARAEILSPGIKLPTFDGKADPKKTRDSLCALRRKALRQAYANDKTRDSVAPFVPSKPNFKTLDCAKMQAAFIASSELIKRSNNATPAGQLAPVRVTDRMAEISRKNKEFWANH